jgi:hypothetical protein
MRIGCILVLAFSIARADDNPGMQLMGLMMRCPAISADGKHVAIYSYDNAADKDAKTSLAVLGASGAVEQRVAIVPPATDAARAKETAGKLVKLLDDGGYKRMSRVARLSEDRGKTYKTKLNSEDVVIDLSVTGRKVDVRATRDGKALAPVSRTLAAKDGACKAVTGYSLLNTAAGFDPKTGLLAFSIVAADADNPACFSHDFVVTLK